MTWRDKLEIGLKKDAEFRKDNLPEEQVRGPEVPAGPGRSPVIPEAKKDAAHAAIDPAEEEKVRPGGGGVESPLNNVFFGTFEPKP